MNILFILLLVSSVYGQCNYQTCTNRTLVGSTTGSPTVSLFLPYASHIGYLAKTDEEYNNILNTLIALGIGPWSPVAYLNTTATYCNQAIAFANKGQATSGAFGFFEILQIVPTGTSSWLDEYYNTRGPGHHYTALQAIPGVTLTQFYQCKDPHAISIQCH